MLFIEVLNYLDARSTALIYLINVIVSHAPNLGEKITPLLPVSELERSAACLAMQRHHEQFCAALKTGDKVLLLRRYGSQEIARGSVQCWLRDIETSESIIDTWHPVSDIIR